MMYKLSIEVIPWILAIHLILVSSWYPVVLVLLIIAFQVMPSDDGRPSGQSEFETCAQKNQINNVNQIPECKINALLIIHVQYSR